MKQKVQFLVIFFCVYHILGAFLAMCMDVVFVLFKAKIERARRIKANTHRTVFAVIFSTKTRLLLYVDVDVKRRTSSLTAWFLSIPKLLMPWRNPFETLKYGF